MNRNMQEVMHISHYSSIIQYLKLCRIIQRVFLLSLFVRLGKSLIFLLRVFSSIYGDPY